MPDDDDLYQLRQNALGLPDVISPETKMNINEPLLFLLLDMLNPFIDNLISHALKYYCISISSNENKIFTAKILAFRKSLMMWGKEDVYREGYPYLLVALTDTFIIFFANAIGIKKFSFPNDDTLFKTAFEKEWQRIAVHANYMYDFEVMPMFSSEDIFRYLRLPFTNKILRNLSKQKSYQEVMNYVVSIATFKPMPDGRIRTYYRQELCKLFVPLITSRIKKITKKKQFLLNTETLREELEKELAKIANGFEFFYATRNNLQNKHQTALNSLNFPLRGELVELGTLSSNNQYPFTAYITKKFEEKIRTYFSDDFKGELTISLDKPIENGFEEYGSMADLISNESQNNINYIPDYDAKDASDNILGWKIKTFAGIVEKSVDTLRRWEKRGLIKPKRYEIYSPIQHKKIYYRAYTKDHVKQAKNINNIMDKKKRHQT